MESMNIEKGFAERFQREPLKTFRAPGRIELGGNHTDHQKGKVIAGAVSLFARAAAAPAKESLLTVVSEGYGESTVPLDDLSPDPREKGRSSALVRGTAFHLLKKAREKGASPAPFGLDIYVSSEVPEGSGLSSSASFEIVVARALCGMWGLELSPLEIAICCRAAENEHYAKPCGLMDQLSCAGEGTVYIDFKDMSAPVIKPLSLKPEEHGFSLILSDCGRDHADLTGDFESITKELSAVSACFGKSFLREVPEKMFMNELSALRRICGDRAVLRAMHVYGENARVDRQLAALEADDFDAFLALVRESGLSSWRLLQNVVPSKDPARQEMAVGLALSERILAGRGACRVQGGGFAGWLQAYVPFGLEETYVSAMESCLGTGCCRRVSLL